MALVPRVINATFVLGQGDFGEAGEDTVEVEGLRVSANIANAGGRSMGTLNASIFGMTLSVMNQLSTLGMIATATRKNSVTLTAGDDGGAMPVVFQGTVYNAWTDLNASPQAAFHVIAQTGTFPAVRPIVPTSVRDNADVAQIMSGLATQMGKKFVNHGVTARLPGAYYSGSAWSQATDIVNDAGIEWNSGELGVVEIWNPGQSRGGQVVVVSKDTGLQNYPTFTANGIMLETLFNPSIGLGTKIRVESQALDEVLNRALKAGTTPATGVWVVYKIDHQLDANVPGGRWKSTLLAAPPGLGPFVP